MQDTDAATCIETNVLIYFGNLKRVNEQKMAYCMCICRAGIGLSDGSLFIKIGQPSRAPRAPIVEVSFLGYHVHADIKLTNEYLVSTLMLCCILKVGKSLCPIFDL